MEKPGRSLWPPLIALILLGSAGIALAAFFRPMPNLARPESLLSDAGVSVERQGLGIAFSPLRAARVPGLVFYPGARVPPEAYAYLGRALANAGFPVFIVRFPLNFAIFAINRADRVAASHPEVGRWAIGGHSLGGAMAAAWAEKASPSPAGILLLAAYPGGGTDLSGMSLRALSVSASEDALATPAKVAAARRLLPAGARAVELNGGNHAQFGEYGPQPGDGTAGLAGTAQRRAVLEESLAFMESLATL